MKQILYICNHNAEVAQLVELQPSKLVVASSSLVFRSSKTPNLLGVFLYVKVIFREIMSKIL